MMRTRLRRGAVSVYVLMATVMSVGALGYTLNQASQLYTTQRKNEDEVKARLAAEAAIASEDSKTNQLGVPQTENYVTVYNGYSISVTTAPVDVERSAAVGELVTASALKDGRITTVRSSYGKRRLETLPQWHFATRAMKADSMIDLGPQLWQAVSSPNWQGVKLQSSRSGYASLTLSDFSLPLEYGTWQGHQFFASYGTPSRTNYDVAVFVADTQAVSFASTRLQASRGATRCTITNLVPNGTSVLYVSYHPNNYEANFRIQKPPAGVTQTGVLLVDLDAFANGTAVKNAIGNLEIALSEAPPTSTSSPRVDAVAYLGPKETYSKAGWHAEYASTLSNGYWPWGRVWDPSSPDLTFLRRIDSSVNTAMSSRNYSHAIGADSQYWFITYTGTIAAPTTGTYLFGSSGWADNGFWVWVNGNLAYNSQSGYNPGISLTAGQTANVVIEVFDGGGYFGVNPRYQVDGGPLTDFANLSPIPGFGTQLIYHNDFDSGVSDGWTFNNIATAAGAQGETAPVNGITSYPEGNTKLGASKTVYALGPFGSNGNYAELDLGSPPAGQYIVYFNFILHNSWDGNNAWGPDNAVLRANGTTIFEITPTMNSITQGTTGDGKWRFRRNSWNNDRQDCSLCVRFTHSGGPLNLRFSSEGPQIQSIPDESWSLDNLIIKRLRESAFE